MNIRLRHAATRRAQRRQSASHSRSSSNFNTICQVMSPGYLSMRLIKFINRNSAFSSMFAKPRRSPSSKKAKAIFMAMFE